jgi:hypothetical protein
LAGLAAFRRQVNERQAALAAEAAGALVADLVEFSTGRPDSDLEDKLCVRRWLGHHSVTKSPPDSTNDTPISMHSTSHQIKPLPPKPFTNRL